MYMFFKILHNILSEYVDVNVCYCWLFTGRGGSAGGKFRISLALPVGAVINCADNTGLYYETAISQMLKDLYQCNRDFAWVGLYR